MYCLKKDLNINYYFSVLLWKLWPAKEIHDEQKRWQKVNNNFFGESISCIGIKERADNVGQSLTHGNPPWQTVQVVRPVADIKKHDDAK